MNMYILRKFQNPLVKFLSDKSNALICYFQNKHYITNGENSTTLKYRHVHRRRMLFFSPKDNCSSPEKINKK